MSPTRVSIGPSVSLHRARLSRGPLAASVTPSCILRVSLSHLPRLPKRLSPPQPPGRSVCPRRVRNRDSPANGPSVPANFVCRRWETHSPSTGKSKDTASRCQGDDRTAGARGDDLRSCGRTGGGQTGLANGVAAGGPRVGRVTERGYVKSAGRAQVPSCPRDWKRGSGEGGRAQHKLCPAHRTGNWARERVWSSTPGGSRPVTSSGRAAYPEVRETRSLPVQRE